LGRCYFQTPIYGDLPNYRAASMTNAPLGTVPVDVVNPVENCVHNFWG
jgi:hypothetical protein